MCCPVFYSVRYPTHLILSVCCIIDVVHPLLWKQIPPHSPQLRLAPFFPVKEHSHMPLFCLQGVILALAHLSPTALRPVLVHSVHALGHGGQTSLWHSLSYWFFGVLFEGRHRSPVSWESGLWGIFVSLQISFFPSLLLSFSSYSALLSSLP